MSCYHPLKAFVLGVNPETGKNIIRVVNKDFDGSEYSGAGFKQIPIPCGKCIGCRLDYSRDWANRMLAEAKYHESNYFLTLTYDDFHLPKPYSGSKINPLVKRDVQLFMKRLRRKFPDQKIRFYACGEYGDPEKTFRPHYHLILFGLKLDDLNPLRISPLGDYYYTSKSIDECWYPEEDKDKPAKERSINGFHVLTSVSWDTCAYVARYVMKKHKGQDSNVYEDLNYPQEFSLMSRKPGIGYDFFADNGEALYAYGSLNLPTQDGAKEIRPCKYYDKLFDLEYPDVMLSIKEDRIDAINQYNMLKAELTDLSYNDILLAAETNKAAATTILKRKEL